GAVVLPGFVQAHVHLCQVLFRGLAEDLPLLRWLRERIWPLEAAHDEGSLRTSAELGLAELLRSGVTSILDMGTVHGQDVVFEAMQRSGIRGLSGKSMVDRGEGMPKGFRESTRASLQSSDALRARWQGKARGRLGYAYAPRFILTCSEALLRGVANRSAETGALMHTHAAEHRDERAEVKRRLGDDDIAILRRFGITGPRAVLAHGVQLRRDEIVSLAREGTSIVHCPSSNLKLASGLAKLRALSRAGVQIGLGSDGAPCNNRLSIFHEMRAAALLAKVVSKRADAVSAADVLAMATRGGAAVLGLANRVGTLEIGKRADVVVVGLTEPEHLPGGSHESQLVYTGAASDVRHVLVDGRIVVERGELLSVDHERLRAVAREEALKVATRAGLS
ncbi:MAG: amidohydrolase family protein, partial [Polyangiaceae bacterium]|nr:amidohydrolase family protein [Polyangiaceae bacterium]